MSEADDLARPGAHSLPELLSGAAVVALVPATDELGLAVAAAWDVARAVAAAGRRVALVDCYVDDPQLGVTTGTPQDGIVDVFEYGASLSRIAQPQAANLYLIPAGTFAPDPVALMANPRWRRLAAGFRHEGALMLLFLAPECLGAIGATLDGTVALAPGGAEAGLAATPEIQAAADAGVPHLATVTEMEIAEPLFGEVGAPDEEGATAAPPDAAPDAAPAAETAEPAVEPERPVGARASWLGRIEATGLGPSTLRRVADVAVLLLIVAAAVVFRGRLGFGELAVWMRGAPPEPAAAPLTPAYRRLVPHPVDTLPLAVQVSAWTSLSFALDGADALEERRIPAMIAVVRLGTRVWYRVLAGPVATPDEADSLLAAVQAAGFDRPRTAAPVAVPLSVALTRAATIAAARAERARLRAAGIAAFVLGQADGSYQLYAGAYAAPAAAAYFDSLITSTGSAGPLRPRVGFRP